MQLRYIYMIDISKKDQKCIDSIPTNIKTAPIAAGIPSGTRTGAIAAPAGMAEAGGPSGCSNKATCGCCCST
jgi:hypothetical protein